MIVCSGRKRLWRCKKNRGFKMGIKKQDFSNWWFGSSVKLERVTAAQLRKEIEEENVGEEVDLEDIPQQLSEAERAQARIEDNN